jgi:zinc transporter, ZIP family
MDPVLIVAAIAVVGPVLGSLLGVLRKPSETVTFNILSFAAGIMLAISFLNLIPEAIKLSSVILAIVGIFCGALLMFGVDRLIPHIHPTVESGLDRTLTNLFVGIFIHNVPEGLAIGIGSVADFKLTIAIALAIAIHDIPESICIAAPYYSLTGNRRKAFLISVSTIIPTLIGFFIAYFLFKYIPLTVVGMLIAATAGLMIYVSGDELIPTSSCRACGHSTILSLIAGVALVVLTQLL